MKSFSTFQSNYNLTGRTKNARRIFLVMNVLLVIGVALVVSTLFYLLFNLNHSDRIIYKCLVPIILGMLLAVTYFIGLDSIKRKQIS
jgi:hypothetical protein